MIYKMEVYMDGGLHLIPANTHPQMTEDQKLTIYGLIYNYFMENKVEDNMVIQWGFDLIQVTLVRLTDVEHII